MGAEQARAMTCFNGTATNRSGGHTLSCQRRPVNDNNHGRELVGSAEPSSHAAGSRSLHAGGEFLKALAGDLAAVVAWGRLSLRARRQRARLSRSSAPGRSRQGPIPQVPNMGRAFWRISIVLLGFLSLCVGALAAVTLWVFFGFPAEPQRNPTDTLAAQFEARRVGASPQSLRPEPEAQAGPGAAVTNRTVASAALPPPSLPSASPPAQSGDSVGANAGGSSEPKQAGGDRPPGPAAGTDQPQLARAEPQDRQAATPQQEMPATLTDLRPQGQPPGQCDIQACAGRYASFHAADCTYQPHGGGPRHICELAARSADARPQTPRAATDAPPVAESPPVTNSDATDSRASASEAKDTQVADSPDEDSKAATPPRAGGQCNVDLCSSTYASFHAADCTYQPHGGGPRRICER
jgi:hypothetical protein